MKIKYTPTSEKLDGYDEREIAHLDIKNAWIEYNYECYSGCGHFIGERHSGAYFHHDMGHCSCNTSLDGIRGSMGRLFDTRERMLEICSKELREELSRILKTAV